MSDTSTKDFYTKQAKEARGPDQPGASKQKPRRKWLRIAIAAASSLVVLVGALVGGGYLYVNHEVGSIQRIHVAALDAKTQAMFSAGTQGSMNILLTTSGSFPGANVDTGLIELIHFNARDLGGAVISFPANLLVSVPGHGKQTLGTTLALGGPSLMIETLERLTHVRIQHYSRVTYSAVPQILNAIGSVNAIVPYPTTSFGFYFHAGVNRITAANALAYVRQPLVSQVTRTELQENLFRAILHAICSRGYFQATDWKVLDAVVRAVSVDTNLSNSELVHLALYLGSHMQGGGTSIVVPTLGAPDAGYTTPVFLQTALAHKLWRAIRTDSVVQLAKQYPSLVTPIAPG
jgi:LCP family protein required for cell wall assembly